MKEFLISRSSWTTGEERSTDQLLQWFVCMQCYRECSGKRLLITDREVKKLSGRVIPEGSLKEKVVDVRKLQGIESRERGQHGKWQKDLEYNSIFFSGCGCGAQYMLRSSKRWGWRSKEHIVKSHVTCSQVWVNALKQSKDSETFPLRFSNMVKFDIYVAKPMLIPVRKLDQWGWAKWFSTVLQMRNDPEST